MYRHASLGVNVNIVVAKILLLGEDQVMRKIFVLNSSIFVL